MKNKNQMNDIRKISVGPDYKNAMHYSIGQSVINGSYTISNIKQGGNGVGWSIFIENGKKEMFLWKSISENFPCIIEYNIDFE
jgi:hypothetical protein